MVLRGICCETLLFSHNQVPGKKESRGFSLIYISRNIVSVGSNRCSYEARLIPCLVESFDPTWGTNRGIPGFGRGELTRLLKNTT